MFSIADWRTTRRSFWSSAALAAITWVALAAPAPAQCIPGSETFRFATPPNPPNTLGLLGGLTGPPTRGAAWNPFIGFGSLDGAVVDFLMISLMPGINVPLPSGTGTLLCGAPLLVQIVAANPSGTVFHIPIPNMPSVVGVSGCAQAGSFAFGPIIELTNAVDFVVGGCPF